MTDAETRYAQIEKELLVVLFGMERFHQYTYGREVTVECDHLPIESIVKKPLSNCPLRLQRMLLRLQKSTISRSSTNPDQKCMYRTCFQSIYPRGRR